MHPQASQARADSLKHADALDRTTREKCEFFLECILTVFPDAKFIHLHRHLNEVLGSIFSLAAPTAA
ncbi:MAG: sulfotransferase [Akkermansiaceae bacterium]